MSNLIRKPNILRFTTIFKKLLEMHDGLHREQSVKIISGLSLILINHVGDINIVLEAITAAKQIP